MKEIEGRIDLELLSFERDSRVGLSLTTSQGTLGYGQWSKLLEDFGAKKCSEPIVSCASMLYTYNEALVFYEDLPLDDAQKHLSEFFDKKRREYYTQTDTWLDEQYVSLTNIVKRHTEIYGEPNHPKLNILSKHLLDIYADNSKSKVVVFTTTRFHTNALMNWLQMNIDLIGFVKPGRLVGSHSSGDLGKFPEG